MAPEDTAKLMGHAYDGIREYDNPLPGWWVWLFVLTIAFCFPYIAWFHLGVGPSLAEQYEAEVGAFYEEQMALLGELKADDATVLSFMGNEGQMMGIAGLFKGNCGACHGADGGGGVGPNLCDDSYINIRELGDIHGLLERGVLAKGMPAWKGQLNDNQLVLMTAYVAKLRGTHPAAPREAQGNVIAPWPASPAGSGEVED